MSLINDTTNNGAVYVRVGDNGLIEFNLNPSAFDNVWYTAPEVPVSANLYAVAWSGYQFYAFGAGGIVLVSDDAELWFEIEAATSINAEDLFGAMADPDIVLACGAQGVILASFDEGFSWELIPTGTEQTLRDIDASGGQFVAVGDNDAVVVGSLTTNDPEIEQSRVLAIGDTVSPGGVFGVSISDGIGVLSKPNRERLFNDATVLLHSDRALFGDDLTHEVSGDVESGVDGSITDLTPEISESLALVQNHDPLIVGDQGATKFGRVHDFVLNTQSVLDVGSTSNILMLDAFTILMRFPDHYASLVETLNLDDELIGAYHKTLAEILDIADVAARRFIAYEVVEETAAAGDLPTTSGVLAVTVDETVAGAGTWTPGAVLRALLTESAGFGVALRNPEGEVFDAWVVNTEHEFFAVTRYTNYNFISMCFAKDGAFATDGAKIYKLDGDNDDGADIDATVQFAGTDFGTAFQKNMPRAYMGVRTNGDMVLKTITDQSVERFYKVKHKADGLHNAYVKLGKGVKARYWAFELVNVDGADFELDSIEYVPVQLSKRSR